MMRFLGKNKEEVAAVMRKKFPVTEKETFASKRKVYSGEELPNEQYHGGLGVSSSNVKEILASPLHMVSRMLLPQEPSPAMEFGTALHRAVLEPKKFETAYAVPPKVDRRTKEGKAAWEEWVSRGYVPISQEDMDTLFWMRDSVMGHPKIGPLLQKAEGEISCFSRDQETGLLLKCRFDALVKDLGIALDLKTTQDATPEEFARSIEKFKYYVQDPFYRNVGGDALGTKIRGFLFVAMEKKAPYQVQAYLLSEEDLALGEIQIRKGLDLLKKCLDSGEFPGYSNEIQEIAMPGWARRKIVGGGNNV